MEQLYFLSILCNGLGGYILFCGNENDNVIKQTIPPVFNLVLGIMCAVTGVLKLLSPFGSRFIIMGDLVPAAAGVIAGIALIFGIYRQNVPSVSAPGSLDKYALNILTFRKPIGLGLFASALLHFLFTNILFL